MWCYERSGVGDTMQPMQRGAVEHSPGVRSPMTSPSFPHPLQQPLLEWLANGYKKFGCQLEFVTNRSQEGSQFCRGFGGIGGLLRYAVNTAEFEEPDDVDRPGSDEEWTSDEDI